MISRNNYSKTNIQSDDENIGSYEIEALNSETLKKNKELINKFDQINDLEITSNQVYSTKNKKNDVNDSKFGNLDNIYYYTKIINWYDVMTGLTIQRTIVCQNESGPCPIIALANLIILQNSLKDLLPGHLSANNSQIFASSLLSIIADYIVSNVSEENLDDVLSHLPYLHKDLNVNPCFKDSLQFDSQETKIFSALKIQLLHGWLPSIQEDGQDVYDSVIKVETYKNALEKITSMKEFLGNKNSEFFDEKKNSEGQLLNRFLCSYSNCLTPHGLTVLRSILSPGKLSILFYNLHFSLLYSHYQTGELYTLVTDFDYKDYDKVVWKSLETFSYFSSEFIPQNLLCNDLSEIENDFAFALNMQLIEDQQKENWVYHLSRSQKYKKSKILNKHKQKKSKSDNILIPNWKRRNSSGSLQELNEHLHKEKKCIIF
ncbi:uncharacterized protein T551_01844 [Pneumocystis jirovecii RU7]|uniref:MINDY deubiquitinase domain-containing protein n=1 Tax=Pneumocystis jirovecii (strain RU7) TaxID=1408657 RepID=A0A0W4ZQB3_PNEJ7|nr:uncharacterized protein T551_01844 [Pneumocystis jirovecii RU7]KTW30561.1 hypothetical protein T551_01844 [Pneumocystis jirovecii RU7]